MSIKEWENGRKLNIHDPDVEDLFAINPEFGDNNELMEEQARKNRNIVNQAR